MHARSVISDSLTPWIVARLLCPWDFQVKNIVMGSHFLLHMCCAVLSCFSPVRLFATVWTITCQSSPSTGFSGKYTGGGCCALCQEIFPTQELNQSLVSPALAGRFFTTSTIWEASVIRIDLNIFVLFFFIGFQLLLKKLNIIFHCRNYNSVQFSCSVVSDSLRPHGLQHVRPPCLSQTTGACSNSRQPSR